MKAFSFLTVIILLFCYSSYSQAEEIASFKGQQLTGVTVTDKGRIFTNFPRWRQGVKYSVVEIDSDNLHKPYPDNEWNSWKAGSPITDSVFVAVQSVVASKDKLYILDTRNPFFQGVQGAPRIFVFSLESNDLEKIYVLEEASFHPDSYINDLRIDHKRNHAWFTDSGNSGLVMLNLINGESRRILDEHPSTSAETDHLVINGKQWGNPVHSDGIALDANKELLYYHALTGYTLYALPLSDLPIENTTPEALVMNLGKTPAPDGMITDEKGNLYMADLENHKIVYRTPSGELKVLLEGDQVRWADTFSIYNGYLYYTNSRIHEAGNDISELNFQIMRVALPE